MRRIVAVLLGLLGIAAGVLALMAYDFWRTEESLAHEVGDDSAMFAAAALLFLSVAVALCAVASLVWWWPSLRRRWRDERESMREMRES